MNPRSKKNPQSKKNLPSKKIEQSQKTTSRYIALDVVEKILLKLPVKSIIRFGGVCKAWYDLSKSCRFAALHHTQTDYQSVLQTWVYKGKELEYLYGRISKAVSHLENNLSNLNMEDTWPYGFELGELSKNQDRYSSDFRSFELAGNCNGIVCITNKAKIFLMNPSLREIKQIPQGFGKEYHYLVGLGFDHLTSDFKVVTIFKPGNQMRARVYSLSTNSWTVLGEIHVDFIWPKSYSTFFNGFVHWCVYGRRILTFDTSTHVFRLVELPLDVDVTDSRLFVLNQKFLAFVSRTRNTKEFRDIWVMKEYGVEESWTKLYTIGPLAHIIHPVSFWEDDKLLLRTKDKLVLYDMRQKQASGSVKLSLDQTSRFGKRFGHSLGFSVCKESLVSFSSM